MGYQIVPDDASTIEDVIITISRRPCRAEIIVAGKFNADLVYLEGTTRLELIVVALVTAVLEDMSTHFIPRQKPWLRDGCTWSMIQGGLEVRSRTNYLLGTDRHLFQNVLVRDVHPNSDHYLVTGCLHVAPAAYHSL